MTGDGRVGVDPEVSRAVLAVLAILVMSAGFGYREGSAVAFVGALLSWGVVLVLVATVARVCEIRGESG